MRFQNHGKIAWVKRIIDDSQASWKITSELFLHKRGNLSFLTKCKCEMKMLDHNNPPTLNDFGVLVKVKKSICIRLRYQSAT